MRITQLRQADLNLLVVFTALAEERSVSRAATRPLLSQPAVSRALQRLRGMFHDDLLIRTAAGYQPTARGERLMQELSVMLPRLDRLLSGAAFDPSREEATFRIAVTDNASQVLCPTLCRALFPFRGACRANSSRCTRAPLKTWSEAGSTSRSTPTTAIRRADFTVK
jgi:DNA-binding transcriptional LysR family regulator